MVSLGSTGRPIRWVLIRDPKGQFGLLEKDNDFFIRHVRRQMRIISPHLENLLSIAKEETPDALTNGRRFLAERAAILLREDTS